jgi:hypothetical protein
MYYRSDCAGRIYGGELRVCQFGRTVSFRAALSFFSRVCHVDINWDAAYGHVATSRVHPA